MLEVWDMEFKAGGKKSALATRRSRWGKTLPDQFAGDENITAVRAAWPRA